jgi:hypothetical protein
MRDGHLAVLNADWSAQYPLSPQAYLLASSSARTEPALPISIDACIAIPVSYYCIVELSPTSICP